MCILERRDQRRARYRDLPRRHAGFDDAAGLDVRAVQEIGLAVRQMAPTLRPSRRRAVHSHRLAPVKSNLTRAHHH
jgi:hypothetical protein